MTRRKREVSTLGIYHVMLRGINKQDIFLDSNDFESMLKALREVQCKKGPDGRVLNRDNCTFYAYCILHNHMHVLIKEGELSISDIMKRLQDRFVAIYNRKYDRVGHLFQDRFASEPVNDNGYLMQLLKYIHRNPVKAMEASTPEEYEWSSWKEYLSAGKSRIIKGSDPFMTHERRFLHLCDTREMLDCFGFDELVNWVNGPDDQSEEAKRPLDMDSFRNIWREVDVWERLAELSGCESVEFFKQLNPDEQVKHISVIVDEGASINQCSRMSSMSYRALWNRLNPAEYEAEKKRKKEERKRIREEKQALKSK